MIRILHLALVLSIVSTPIFTQIGGAKNVGQTPPDSPTFQRFTEEDGLSQNTVTSVLQDSKGFLWVGTVNGLNRFDGYRFAVYKYDFQNPQSISNNYIVSIYETKAGQIWIGTNKGLNRYDSATDGFKSFKFDADDPNSLGDDETRTLYEDSGETFWIGTEKGLSKFNAATANFTNYDASILTSGGVRGIAEDKQGRFWVGTSSGLINFNRQTGRLVKHFKPEPKNSNSLSQPAIRKMIIDRAGIAWIATTDAGLNRFDPNTEQFTRYTADKNKPRSLNDNVVRSLCESKTGTLWVGTGAALNRYSRETDDFTVYKNDPANPRSLSEGDIPTIFEGDNDQLWVGTSIGGLNKFNQKTNRFLRFRHEAGNPNSLSDDYYIHSIWEDENKVLWIATQDGGLNKYDLETKRFEVIKTLGDPKASSTEIVSTIFQDREGNFWLGTPFQGLVLFDRKTELFKAYRYDKNDPHSLNGYLVYSVAEDRAGSLWVGTGRGLNRLDRSLDKFTRFPSGLNIQGSFNGESVQVIFEDSSGVLWVSTNRGLNKFDSATQSFTHYLPDPNNPKSISGADVNSIVEDKSGTLWFGTDAGLNRFDRQSETFSRFTETEGFPSNNISSILEDEPTGNLWVGTGKGLARFNPATKDIRTYDVNDGLTHSEFTPKSAFKNRNGEMYFGTIRGAVKFDPRNLNDSDFRPPIYLSEIRIFEQPAQIRQNITELKELNLSWRDNVVSFDFAALDFTDSKKLQYQWKLDGFDEKWINGGTRRTATYTNLPGGDYILKVRATNVDGIWTDEALNLKISVEPPFYRTFWFAALVGLIIGFVAWRAYRFRIDQLHAVSDAQKRFTQQLINSQEAERKRIAAELHDGLGQSLVIIKNRAMLGIGKRGDEARVAKELNTISESASQALDEVRDITNNLRPQLLDRLGLTKALNSMLKKVSGVIEVKSEIDSIDNLFSENEEISIYRIVQESVNNIVKHSKASDAGVRISRTGNRVSIEIEDNGTGFNAADAEEKRAGMGLIGMRERAQLLGGELTVDSRIGAGTKIRIVFPLK